MKNFKSIALSFCSLLFFMILAASVVVLVSFIAPTKPMFFDGVTIEVVDQGGAR